MTNGRNEYAPIYRGILIERFGGHCEARGCGETFGLEFAHVSESDLTAKLGRGEREGRGRKERQSDVSKNPLAYLLLCGPHHDRLSFLERKFKSLAGSRVRALAALASETIDSQETWVL